MAMDDFALLAIAASAEGSGEGALWARRELAQWALEGRRLRTMVAREADAESPELRQALEQAAQLYRSERRRARAVNLSLGALVASVVILLAMQLGLVRGREVQAAGAATAQQVHALELKTQELEQLLKDMDRNLTQSLEWHAQELKRQKNSNQANR